MHPRHPGAVAERDAIGGGVAATPLIHTQNRGMSRDRGVATPWSATGGGVASAPLSFRGFSTPLPGALVSQQRGVQGLVLWGSQ